MVRYLEGDPVFIDESGRVVIPVDIRTAVGIKGRDQVAFYVDGDDIIVRRVKTVPRSDKGPRR